MNFQSLKGKRIELGLTQEQVAQSIGISRKTLSLIEKHLQVPSLIDTVNLCKVYNISIIEMLQLLRIDTDELI